VGALPTDCEAVAPAYTAFWEALVPVPAGGQFLFAGLLLLVLARVLEELARIRAALEAGRKAGR
jgi:hypothetical protein